MLTALPTALEMAQYLPAKLRQKAERQIRGQERQRIHDTLGAKLRTLLDTDPSAVLMYTHNPFVTAGLAWDMADTACDMARVVARQQPPQFRAAAIKEVKTRSRIIRQLKAEYDRYRAGWQYATREDDVEVGIQLYDELKQLLTQTQAAVKHEAMRLYPDLSSDNVCLLVAVYECLAVLSAIRRYTERRRVLLSERIGMDVPDILPLCLYCLSSAVLTLVGRHPLDKRWYEGYGETVTNILITKLNSTKYKIQNEKTTS